MRPDLLLAETTLWHTVVVFLFILLGLRFLARRLLGQLTAIDFLVILLLGSAVQTSMVADTSLGNGLFCAAVVLGIDRVLAVAADRWPAIAAIIGGSAIVLVQDGKIIAEGLRRSGLTHDNLLEAIRAQGFDRLDQVRYAVFEAQGQVSVVAMDRRVHRSTHRAKSQPVPSAPASP